MFLISFMMEEPKISQDVQKWHNAVTSFVQMSIKIPHYENRA